MEFLSDPGYWKFAGPAYGIALLLGFVCVSQGTIGRNYFLQTLLFLGWLALVVFVFINQGWILGVVTFFAAWTIMRVGAQVQMRMYEKFTGHIHPDRPAEEVDQFWEKLMQSGLRKSNPMDLGSKFECLLYTNDLLDRLVKYHNELFAGGLGLLFRKINYGELRDLIRGTLQTLQETELSYHQLEAGPLPLDWPAVDAAYVEYCANVQSAYSKLANICDGLHQKAIGMDYTKAKYDADCAEYERLVRAYQEVGNRLTRLVKA